MWVAALSSARVAKWAAAERATPTSADEDSEVRGWVVELVLESDSGTRAGVVGGVVELVAGWVGGWMVELDSISGWVAGWVVGGVASWVLELVAGGVLELVRACEVV